MVRQSVTWFVVADGSRARILTRRSEGPGYDVTAELDSPQARRRTRDLVSDEPGHTQESAYSGRHAVERRSDEHDVQKAGFARQLATRLDAAATKGDFDSLVLYAAPRTLAELRGALAPATQRKIKAEFAKDLTRLPLAELYAQFDQAG